MKPVLSLAWLACLAACTTAPPDTSRPDPDGGLLAREAPMLHRLVEQRALPPVGQRLPLNPLIVTPAERLGEYGGTWRMMADTPRFEVFKVIGEYTPLIRWNADASGIVPGLANAWEMSSDGLTLTLHLRHGVKWSDGVEFTSNDLSYWADIASSGTTRSNQQNTALVMPGWGTVDGQPMTTSAPDRYTFVMHFAGPRYFAPMNLATGFQSSEEMILPRHYFEQFDPRLHPEVKDWALFTDKNQPERNPERPTLAPWHLVRLEDAGIRGIFERNPYYWMVDSAGRQLPYIDRVAVTVVPDEQLRVLRILAGDVDAQFRRVELRNLELLTRGEKKGHYHIELWREGTGAQEAIFLNWSAPDPVLKDLIRDVRFREALSLAIDRNRINEVTFNGLGIPQQATISRESWHFRSEAGKAALEAWARSFSDFDLLRANGLLDQMGLTRRDSAGFRLRPDGRRLSLVFDLPPANQMSFFEDEAPIISNGWRALGIEVFLRNFPLAIWDLRQHTGEFTVSGSMEAEMDLFTYPDWVFPTTEETWHSKVGRWYMKHGREGDPPTGPMLELIDIYEKIQREPDLEKAQALVLEGIRIQTEQIFSLGTVADLPAPIIVRNNFHNIPKEPGVLAPWGVVAPATSFPESFFFGSEPVN